MFHVRASLRVFVLATSLLVPFAVAAPAQDTYGTTSLSYEQVPGAVFFPSVSGFTYTTSAVNSGQILRIAGANSSYFAAPIRIPSGAIVKSLELDACDNTGGAGGFVQGTIVQTDALGNTTASLNPFLMTAGTGCQVVVSGDLTSLNIVADNHTKHMWLIGFLDAQPAGKTVGLAGMTVGYQLQVSPGPLTATFNDVPTSDFGFQFVEAFAGAGITVGCTSNPPFTPPVYCPDRNVTRREMAIFFAKALGLQWP